MKRLSIIMVAILLLATSLLAEEYSVVVPELSPTAVSVYSNVIKAILEAEGHKANISVLPFARAVYMMETKQADIMSAIIQIPDQKKWSELKYDYSTPSFVKVVFVLYTNKNKPISAADIKSGNIKGYKIETDAAHILHFPFASASSNIEGSLRKVDAGIIDGFIFAQGTTDAILKKIGLKNIKREYFDTLAGVFILKKGERGGPLDKIIVSGLAKIMANGEFNKIAGEYAKSASTYIDWQP